MHSTFIFQKTHVMKNIEYMVEPPSALKEIMRRATLNDVWTYLESMELKF